jgi:hypothetical protein
MMNKDSDPGIDNHSFWTSTRERPSYWWLVSSVALAALVTIYAATSPKEINKRVAPTVTPFPTELPAATPIERLSLR